MRTIIVSDMHLSNKFDEAKFNFIKNLFESCDKLIINGDFWSAYSTTFDDFLKSEWSRLFPLMLEKKAVCIYGNHDRAIFMDQRANLFSIEQCERTTYTLGKEKYHIEHGHLFFRHQTNTSPRFMELNRRLNVEGRITRPAENMFRRVVGTGRLSKTMNNHIKGMAADILGAGYILVTGHTHMPELDRESKFVCTGFVGEGVGWYMEITEDGYNLVKGDY